MTAAVTSISSYKTTQKISGLVLENLFTNVLLEAHLELIRADLTAQVMSRIHQNLFCGD